MRATFLRGVLYAAAGTFLLSCADVSTAPRSASGTAASLARTPGAKVVISQVYGAGGNSGAPITHDYIELFNAGSASQDLSAWSIQYASATGTGNFSGPALTGSIAPGQYYLIQMSGSSSSNNLPAPDAVGTITMAAGAGKVALVDGTTSLGCNGGSNVCDATALGRIVDLVGYGTGTSGANFFEGSSPAPTIGTSTADFRAGKGCTDSNQNGADFSTGAPAPRNRSTTWTCSVGPFDHVGLAAITVSANGSLQVTAELQDASDQKITDAEAVFTWTIADQSVAKVDPASTKAAATIKGLVPGNTTVTVSATSNGITKSTKAPVAITVVGPLDHVAITGPVSLNVGATASFTATLKDAADHTLNDAATTYLWTSSDAAIANPVSGTANPASIKGIAPGTAAITLSATLNGVTKSITSSLDVVPSVIVPSTTVVSEVHYDNTGTDAGEAIEIEGDAGTSLDGWKLLLYDGKVGTVYNTVTLGGTFPVTCAARGVLVFTFPVNGIQNGGIDTDPSSDGWALVNPAGQVTELRSYEGTFTAKTDIAAGLTSTALEADEIVPPARGRSVMRAGNGVWYGPRTSTLGACNSPVPLGAQGSITLSSGKTELALGMQTQFFFSGTTATGQTITSVAWSTSNPAVITVDARGVVTAKGLGSATLIAAAGANDTGTVDMSVYIAAGATGIRLGHNEEFGTPRDATPGDEFIIRRDQYTVSYNPARGGANWVSWNLDRTHVGDNGRCSGTCYSADTVLTKAGITAYTTADWVSGATWDRGHMAPSADWTSSEADNNTTFFLTNFLPQAPDLNQGPWERLEAALRDSVAGGREAYIIAGGIFTNGTGLGSILNLGRIWIPDSTYKIAIITPAGTGIGAGGVLPANTTVLAVNMPNVQGIRGVDWMDYRTTIAKIERSTGYDYLDLLTEPTECLAERRNCTPTARITAAAFTAKEGQSLGFDASTSTDPNEGDHLTAAWAVNGSPAGTGESFTYTFANDGLYEVKLTVTDESGSTSVAVATVSISNVEPVIAAFAGATILRGETYTAAGSFTDPGADTWAAAVNYGDGSSAALPLDGQSFTLSHAYTTAGTYTVAVSVNDGSVTPTRTATVVVKTSAQGIADLQASLASLGANPSLMNRLNNAAKHLEAGQQKQTVMELGSFIDELDRLARDGRVNPTDAATLMAYARRVIAAL